MVSQPTKRTNRTRAIQELIAYNNLQAVSKNTLVVCIFFQLINNVVVVGNRMGYDEIETKTGIGSLFLTVKVSSFILNS